MYSDLVDSVIPADQSNYSASNYRKKVNKIVIHHMAGVLTAEQCGNIFASPRGASAHYGVGIDGKIGGYVPENCVAWHAGDWVVNQESIGIELSNDNTGGDWSVSDQTLNRAIELVADIAKRYNLGKLVAGKNLTWHSMHSQTYCPGDYLRARIGLIATKANEINYPSTPNLVWSKFMNIKRYQTNKQPTNLWKVDVNHFDDCTSIRKYDKGTIINIYGKLHNPSLNADYYLTEWSYKNKVPNGFNPADLDEIKPKLVCTKFEHEKKYITTSQPTNLWNFNEHNAEDCKSVKKYDKGTPFMLYGKVHNCNFNGDYYVTKWCYDNQVPNGFNPYDLEEVVETEQKPTEDTHDNETNNEPTHEEKPHTEQPSKPQDEFDLQEAQDILDKLTKSVNLINKTQKEHKLPSLEMSNRVYDALKLLATTILPAFNTLYIGLSSIWGFGFGEEIDKTIQLLVAFINAILGAVVVKASKDYKGAEK